MQGSIGKRMLYLDGGGGGGATCYTTIGNGESVIK